MHQTGREQSWVMETLLAAVVAEPIELNSILILFGKERMHQLTSTPHTCSDSVAWLGFVGCIMVAENTKNLHS
jgi:hypothetical protein